MLKVVIGCLLASYFISCSSSQQQDIIGNNPNKDSELTLLMREMYINADSIKNGIKTSSGTITPGFITKLEYVHKAIPSNPKFKNPTFTAFNDLIITEARNLESNTENRIEGFNNLVNRCIDCHKTFCPGPIPRIKKLKIAN